MANNHRKTRRQRNLEKLANALRLGYKIPPALARELPRANTNGIIQIG